MALPLPHARDLVAHRPQLVVALQCNDLSQPSSRHALEGLARVAISSGPARTLARDAEATLHIGLRDGALPVRRATLMSLGDRRWCLDDDGPAAGGGVYVNGRRLERRALLLDGDLVEIGATLLIYRDAAALAFAEHADLRDDELEGLPGTVTFAAELAHAQARLARVAPSMVPVSVSGATGTGKELAARAVHELSRRSGPFVAVNCGALPAGLVEATLFGHRRGAFSGAHEDRAGFVRAAHGGTLFLDEVAELPASAQVALLRVLQEGEVVPVGDFRPLRVDVRIVTATHETLEALVARGRLRADLAARLAGLAIALPPLARRREDLGLLVRTLAARQTPAITGLTREAARALFAHGWPLNVRELEKALALAAVLSDGCVGLEHLPATLAGAADPESRSAGDPDGAQRRQRQRAELEALLRERGGNVTAVARLLGLGRMQVHRLIRKHGLDRAACLTVHAM